MPPVDEIAMDCYECHDHHHYDEETKESISTNECSNEIPSSAQALVQTAAYKIDMDPSKLDVLLRNMKEEMVMETWQVDFMDFPSWRAMGFPVGLIASIKSVKKEQEDLEESDRKKSMSQRSGGSASEYSLQLVDSKATKMDTNGEEEGELKRRISDITMSERGFFSLQKTRELLMSPPPKPNAFRLKFQSEHKPRERPMYPRVASTQSLMSDMPPIAALRRSSSKSNKGNSNTRSPRRGRKREEQIKDQRRSSITMPLCPPRRPTYTDLASLTKDIDDPSEVESFAADSLAKSKATSETDDVSLALECIMGSKTGEMIENLEKSMDTIITGNLGFGNAWDGQIEDDPTNEEEKSDDHDLEEEEGSFVSVDDKSFTLLRRYTVW